MPTINFPSNPSVDDTYTFGGKTWVWNGSAWQLQSSGAINGIPIGNVTPSTGAFTGLSATGNATAANLLTTGLISATGNVTANYYFGNGSLLTGIITSVANINNGTSNVTVVSSGGNITVGVGGTGNLAVFSTAGLDITGQVSATGNVIGGNIITSGELSATGNVTGNYIIGDGSALTNIAGANVTGTVANASYALSANTASSANVVLDAAQPNITSVGTLTILSVLGNVTGGNLLTGGQVSATGNLTGNYIIGNGSQLTGLPAVYANTNVAVFLADFGSNSISTSGNVTAGQFTGNGALLTDITGANVTGTVANASYALSANTASSANVVLDAAQPNITSVGTLTSVSVTGNAVAGNVLTGGLVSATGNVTAGNLATAGAITATGDVTAGNLLTGGAVSATGNVSANYFLGNGSQLTGITTTSTEIINGTSNVSINSPDANVTITVAGETDSSVFSPGSLFTGILAVPKTLTGNVVMAANSFGTVISGTVITGNLQIPDGTTVYTWTPS